MPVYESHTRDYTRLELGPRLCKERQRQGLTLLQLANRCGISASKLSQIENNVQVADVSEALAIAGALGTPLNSLLPRDRALPCQITRYQEIRDTPPRDVFVAGPHLASERHNGQFWPLADLFVGRQLDPVLLRILPGESAQFCHHHEREFAFVLKGRVEFNIITPGGTFKEMLARGDCIHLRSDLPHRFACTSAEPADIVRITSAHSAPVIPGLDWASPVPASYFCDSTAPASLSLGCALSRLRRGYGWNVTDVAQMVGIRPKQLEQIERGEKPVPLNVMLMLARAYGKPLREFLPNVSEEAPYFEVRRSAEIPELLERRRRLPTDRPETLVPNSYHPITPNFPALHMYPYFVRIRNVDLETLVPHQHHGHEFLYVLQGEVELLTYAEDEELRIMLGAGDCCYLDASVPHLIRGETRNPYSATSAELIDVYWCPLGEKYLFDGDSTGERGCN
jgi:transcriptional regulator with XRE-family HTH domain/uncharacterized RmlC-like cupin family protein